MVSSIIAAVFTSLFTVFMFSMDLVNNSRAKLSALSVANDRMEYFRSLPYDDVGTISGIPSGTIAQNSVVTLNAIDFEERVLVEYVDDPADGQDTATTTDDNGIPSDYKRIKVEYTWNVGNGTTTMFLVSNIVPRSIETTAGGGTAKINVLDDQFNLLAGAEVRLVNNTTTSTIDVTRYTNTSGVALFSGAPAASGYEVYVSGPISGPDYSSEQTYEATTTLPNPSVAPFAVLEADVSTITFQIGELSDLTIQTLADIIDISVEEEFADLTGLSSSTNVVASSDELQLTDTLGVFDTSGSAYLNEINPATIDAWGMLRLAYYDPTNTDLSVQLYIGSSTGPFTLVPDGDLPGNSSGFKQRFVDLSDLDPVSYPSLVVGANLSTVDTAVTPTIDEIGVYYRSVETAMPTTALSMVGTKVIGQDASLVNVYKYDDSFTTDATGEVVLTDIEYDFYTVTQPGSYDIAEACGEHPINLEAGVDETTQLLLLADDTNTLRVSVLDSGGQVMPGADVNLDRTGYDVTQETGLCGQTFFTGGVTDNSDYTLTVTATDYDDSVISSFTVSGDTYLEVSLTE